MARETEALYIEARLWIEAREKPGAMVELGTSRAKRKVWTFPWCTVGNLKLSLVSLCNAV